MLEQGQSLVENLSFNLEARSTYLTKEKLQQIPFQPYDLIEEAKLLYDKDQSYNKLFLSSGELHNEENKVLCFKSVKLAEQKLFNQNFTLDKNYLNPEGDKEYTSLARNLCFGIQNDSTSSQNILSFQTPGATAAIHLAFDFIKSILNVNKIILPKFSWPLAKSIAEDLNLEIHEIDNFDKFTQKSNP